MLNQGDQWCRNKDTLTAGPQLQFRRPRDPLLPALSRQPRHHPGNQRHWVAVMNPQRFLK
jgi:hypothetical protein